MRLMADPPPVPETVAPLGNTTPSDSAGYVNCVIVRNAPIVKTNLLIKLSSKIISLKRVLDTKQSTQHLPGPSYPLISASNSILACFLISHPIKELLLYILLQPKSARLGLVSILSLTKSVGRKSSLSATREICVEVPRYTPKRASPHLGSHGFPSALSFTISDLRGGKQVCLRIAPPPHRRIRSGVIAALG